MKTITLEITHDEANLARRLLKRETEDREYPELVLVKTAKFSNGIEADIKLVNADGPYVDAVIFENGQEITCLPASGSFTGEYQFAIGDDGNPTHQVIIKTTRTNKQQHNMNTLNTFIETNQAKAKTPNAEILERWNDRIVANGWDSQGADGVNAYLAKYGKGIKPAKLIALAVCAESKGANGFAQALWEKALELESPSPTL